MDAPLWLLALIAFGVINFMLISASVLVYAERKVSAYMQNRPGPNRVGPAGFLQPFADVFKLMFKEDITPKGASSFVHSLAPFAMVVIAMTVPAMTFSLTASTTKRFGAITRTRPDRTSSGPTTPLMPPK